MAEVTVINGPATEGSRRALVLTEDRLGHYPEFRVFFVRTFDLDRVGLSEPGFVQAPSGLAYALVFIGRSGEPFPAGIEVYAIVPALEPLGDSWLDDRWRGAAVDRGRTAGDRAALSYPRSHVTWDPGMIGMN